MEGRASLLADLLDAAFRRPPGPDGEGDSLLGNLETVEDHHWDAKPGGGARTIRDIVLHVGSCKFMYDDHAFGSGTFDWAKPPAWPTGWATMPPAALLEWLREGHQALLASARALSDADLESPRKTPWGAPWPARRIIDAMMGHDFYHAGEINHIRALLAGSDQWAYA